jgi:two-component system phosphate regulon response regulator PhoB
LLRRQGPGATATGTVSRVGSIVIDRLALRVTVHNQLVDLTRTEFKLLSTLIESAGRVLSRDTLLTAVWPTDSNIEIRTVDTHLRRLREKLGSAGQLIRTIRGFGYRIDDEAS